MGGGNALDTVGHRLVAGLSPRGRGKQPILDEIPPSTRSIPAWAGETCKIYFGRRLVQVYPRVGGGNSSGLSGGASVMGLSPRGRGKHSGPGRHGPGRRSIPAWAGETSDPASPSQVKMVYPRVGGGNMPGDSKKRKGEGLSPRGRGKLALSRPIATIGRSIPAWAGETRHGKSAHLDGQVYPRVGGGNHRGREEAPRLPGLSPRGRGKLYLAIGPVVHRRSIPAWAGETGRERAGPLKRQVYPRVGGGNWQEVLAEWAI